MEFSRQDSDFHSLVSRCSAWFYQPASDHPVSAVVMAHGFGAERAWKLPQVAERFAAQGIGVLLFDYRGFGESEGEPRQLIHPRLQHEDWRAAIAHVRSLPTVDRNRTGLWGTSFSGGHVLVMAAEDQGISAVVMQIPFVDAWASAGDISLREVLPLWKAALQDQVRAWRGKEPLEIGIYGPPGSRAFLTLPGWAGEYAKLVPSDSRWENRSPARGLLPLSMYRPVKMAEKVSCPVLLLYASEDKGTPARAVEETARKIPLAETVKFQCGHFGLYHGVLQEQSIQQAQAFWRKTLLANR